MPFRFFIKVFDVQNSQKAELYITSRYHEDALCTFVCKSDKNGGRRLPVVKHECYVFYIGQSLRLVKGAFQTKSFCNSPPKYGYFPILHTQMVMAMVHGWHGLIHITLFK